MSRSSLPRPGSQRSLPPRWAAAEESCPRRSGCGQRVLAAPCVRREWSCCKMAAEAHAAGSKPDPVPLASERAPGARARLRVTPPFPPLPRASASLTHSLSPCPPPAPPSPSPTTTSVRQPSSLGPSSSAPCFLLPPLALPFAAAPAQVAALPLLAARWLTRSLPRSFSRPRPPVPAESAPLFLSPALT